MRYATRGGAMTTRGADLTGQRFGRLVALTRGPEGKRGANGGVYWRCVCDCGQRVLVAVNNLRRPTRGPRSCGCTRTPYRPRGARPPVGCAGAM